jgi:ribosome maturation factor RimP
LAKISTELIPLVRRVDFNYTNCTKFTHIAAYAENESGSREGPAFFVWDKTMTDTRLSRETGPAARVAALAEPVLDAMGYRLVRVKMYGNTLQIMGERPDGTFSIGDCEKFSRDFSPMLDVADIISAKYQLEVSSPGIDRPLVRAGDFESWAGHQVKIEMTVPVAGRKRFRGELEGFHDGEVRLFVDNPEGGKEPLLIGVPFADISDAHLVLTDELIAAAKARLPETAIGDGAEIDEDKISEINEEDDNG